MLVLEQFPAFAVPDHFRPPVISVPMLSLDHHLPTALRILCVPVLRRYILVLPREPHVPRDRQAIERVLLQVIEEFVLPADLLVEGVFVLVGEVFDVLRVLRACQIIAAHRPFVRYFEHLLVEVVVGVEFDLLERHGGVCCLAVQAVLGEELFVEWRGCCRSIVWCLGRGFVGSVGHGGRLADGVVHEPR